MTCLHASTDRAISSEGQEVHVSYWHFHSVPATNSSDSSAARPNIRPRAPRTCQRRRRAFYAVQVMKRNCSSTGFGLLRGFIWSCGRQLCYVNVATLTAPFFSTSRIHLPFSMSRLHVIAAVMLVTQLEARRFVMLCQPIATMDSNYNF